MPAAVRRRRQVLFSLRQAASTCLRAPRCLCCLENCRMRSGNASDFESVCSHLHPREGCCKDLVARLALVIPFSYCVFATLLSRCLLLHCLAIGCYWTVPVPLLFYSVCMLLSSSQSQLHAGICLLLGLVFSLLGSGSLRLATQL